MIKFSKGRAVSVLLSIIAIIYLSWSQIALYKYREALDIEKERVYSIADHLELWKEISIKHNGYFDVEKLSKDQRNIEITKINRRDGIFIPDDEILYVMYYDKLNNRRKSELKRFFSELVLSNYFYVITDNNGKIKEMSWDKP
jgi:hypothetical protein